ncbi:hypothetical protein WICMUC_000299 [Wickerhamomyces mucosus]|uniref:BTB domain-containing protein n=1 Tax=Wickerhamomyces mucosus TaxID=1378264 RepID=A0A9P8Q093_9ASCO|nr:hypothetical protein WICMUC_000299 [Wickerhamomyces mucosus]
MSVPHPPSPLSRKQNLRKVEPTNTLGEQPFSRVKSASTVTKDGKLFLFGGFDEDDVLDDNIYLLNIKTNTWEAVRKNGVFREGHSALCTNDNYVIIFGGVPNEEQNLMNHNTDELLIFSMVTKTWIESPVYQGVQVPLERSRHAACLSNDGTKMFISGGLDNQASTFDDLYCYDIRSATWDGPRKFIPRFDHFITHFDDKIWSFGGLTNDMAHVNLISWFDLATNTTGSVMINDLPKLEGDHIFMSCSSNSLVLDVVVPLWTYDKGIEPCIAFYDVESLRWQVVLSGSFKPLLGYRWRHTFMFDSKLYLLGYELTNEINDSSFDYRLSSIINLELSDLGIVKSTNDDNSGLNDDLTKLLKDGKYSDFKIVGIESDERPSMYATFLESSPLEPPSSLANGEVFVKSSELNVHKIILLSRWPYFQRIIDSGMIESQTNTLFLPEPIEWIKVMIEYLYTDKLSNKDINTITGLLVLSNLYELPNLRKLCINMIYSQGFKIKNVLKIWSRARLIGEQVLQHNAITFCFINWGKIVKTKQFKELTRDELLELFQNAGIDTMIVNNSSNNSHFVSSLSEKDDFVLNNVFDRYRSGFNNHSSLSVVGLDNRKNEMPIANADDDDDDDDFEINEERTRFSTPQASIFLTNPQSALNTLGETSENDADADDDINTMGI